MTTTTGRVPQLVEQEDGSWRFPDAYTPAAIATAVGDAADSAEAARLDVLKTIEAARVAGLSAQDAATAAQDAADRLALVLQVPTSSDELMALNARTVDGAFYTELTAAIDGLVDDFAPPAVADALTNDAIVQQGVAAVVTSQDIPGKVATAVAASTTGEDTIVAGLIDTLTSKIRAALYRATTGDAALSYGWSGAAGASTAVRKLDGAVTLTTAYSNPLPSSLSKTTAANGATLSFDSTKVALKVITPISAIADSGIGLTTEPLTAGLTYTVDIEIQAETSGTYRIAGIPTPQGVASVTLASGATGRFRFTFLETVSATRNFYIVRSDISISQTFYVRKILIVPGLYTGPYFDGNTAPQRVIDTLDARFAPTALVAALAARVLVGTGSPLGVISAPVGTEYIDIASTMGASKWRKMSGSAATGWAVTMGDTGSRTLAVPASGRWSLNASGDSFNSMATYRRIGSTVYVDMILYPKQAIPVSRLESEFSLSGLASSVIQRQESNLWGSNDLANYGKALISASNVSLYFLVPLNVNTPYRATFAVPTDAAWPTSLPGTAA